jgi:hypothetical protein
VESGRVRRGCAAPARRRAASVDSSADVLAADAQGAGDLDLGHLASEQAGRLEADLLLGVTVVARALRAWRLLG